MLYLQAYNNSGSTFNCISLQSMLYGIMKCSDEMSGDCILFHLNNCFECFSADSIAIRIHSTQKVQILLLLNVFQAC